MSAGERQAALLVERLREGALADLVEICLDSLLARPLHELLPPERVAAHLDAALQALAARPDLRPWLEGRALALQAGAVGPGVDGRAFPRGRRLRDALPAELTEPLETLLSEPYLPDRALVLRMLDHAAMHSLIQEVLHAALLRFARKMRSLGPDTSALKAGLGRAARLPPGLSRLRSLGSDVASVLSSEIEHQLEQRVSEHVSQAISAVLGHIATLLCAPERAATMGEWRAYGLRVALDTELESCAIEVRKLDARRAAAALGDAIQALVRRPALQHELAKLAAIALGQAEGESLGARLREAGLEEAWREAWRARVLEAAPAVIESEAFRTWLQGWLSCAQPPGSPRRKRG